ncbi:methyltransferase domain-containing protein [Streptomyces sp. LP05-1]|uniref:Protein-L-isoaspartate O-methyltransferase n=1 Tax=Streptomyces pyxinae TaxID=2970734 RepID=A0ABT2CMC8_9ACTN|nr:methyltransferase domain-containing protein [Streptomyces sp. LP05-1]MCS0638592.1 methyltransferase domain-containing protein [Streptomyces sp. LP05-1]
MGTKRPDAPGTPDGPRTPGPAGTPDAAAGTPGTTGAAAASDPYAEAAAGHRRALVRELIGAGELADPAWRAAFEEVPRHLFVPFYYLGVMGGYERLTRDDPDPGRRARWLAGAYEDRPLATLLRDGELVSSSSQPSLMAAMLAALEVRDGDRVLEIGAGTGYNAALLGHRLGDDRVTTVDLDEEITGPARERLAAAGHHPAVLTGDGALGCPGRAPFDAIVATCTLPSVPPAWVGQCRPGARILAPLSTGLIRLRVREPDSDSTAGPGAAPGHAEGRFLRTSAYFVQLRGGATGPAPPVRTGGLTRSATENELFRFLLTLTAGTLDPREAYALWQREGRPARERFGVTVRAGRQWAWLDDPEGPYSWPLGTDGGAGR